IQCYPDSPRRPQTPPPTHPRSRSGPPPPRLGYRYRRGPALTVADLGDPLQNLDLALERHDRARLRCALCLTRLAPLLEAADDLLPTRDERLEGRAQFGICPSLLPQEPDSLILLLDPVVPMLDRFGHSLTSGECAIALLTDGGEVFCELQDDATAPALLDVLVLFVHGVPSPGGSERRLRPVTESLPTRS